MGYFIETSMGELLVTMEYNEWENRINATSMEISWKFHWMGHQWDFMVIASLGCHADFIGFHGI